MAIPQVIHFIWVGTKPIPQSRLENIASWRRNYPNFNTMFWIDPIGTNRSVGPETALALFRQQEQALRALPSTSRLLIQDIETLRESTRPQHTQNSWPIIRYEIDRLRPNYGAASDVLRYEILFNYGGVYIDSDVEPPVDVKNSLYADQSFWRRANQLYVYNAGSSNDVVWSPVRGAGILQLKTHVQDNYGLPRTSDTLAILQAPEGMTIFQERAESKAIIQAYASATNLHIREATIMRTGPRALTNAFAYYSEQSPPTILDIQALAPGAQNRSFWQRWRDWFTNTEPVTRTFTQAQVIRDIASAQDWLGLKPKNFDDLSNAIAVVVDTIRFEASYLKILRLNDHVRELESIFENKKIVQSDLTTIDEKASPEEFKKNQRTLIVQQLFSALPPQEWSDVLAPVQTVQYPFECMTEQMQDFLKIYNLEDKTGFTQLEVQNGNSIGLAVAYLNADLAYHIDSIAKRQEDFESTEKWSAMAAQHLQSVLKLLEYALPHASPDDAMFFEEVAAFLKLVHEHPSVIAWTQDADTEASINSRILALTEHLPIQMYQHQRSHLSSSKTVEEFAKQFKKMPWESFTASQLSELGALFKHRTHELVTQERWGEKTASIVSQLLLDSQKFYEQGFKKVQQEPARSTFYQNFEMVFNLLKQAQIPSTLSTEQLQCLQRLAIHLSEKSHQAEEIRHAFQADIIKTEASHEADVSPTVIALESEALGPTLR